MGRFYLFAHAVRDPQVRRRLSEVDRRIDLGKGKAMQKNVQNGQIKSTSFGYEDHGILTCNLVVEGPGWGCGYGGFAFDHYDAVAKQRVPGVLGLRAVALLLQTLEVDKWEDLPGRYIRVEFDSDNSRIVRVGHLMKDQWFGFKEFFDEHLGLKKD